MAGQVIEEHLAALGPALTLPPRLRRRALLEARDDLLSSAERHREAGLGVEEAGAAAVADHGPPALMARHYAEELADGAAQLATVVGLAAVIAYAALLLSARRTAELAGHTDEPAGDDALDDLRALATTAAARVAPQRRPAPRRSRRGWPPTARSARSRCARIRGASACSSRWPRARSSPQCTSSARGRRATGCC